MAPFFTLFQYFMSISDISPFTVSFLRAIIPWNKAGKRTRPYRPIALWLRVQCPVQELRYLLAIIATSRNHLLPIN